MKINFKISLQFNQMLNISSRKTNLSLILKSNTVKKLLNKLKYTLLKK